MAESFIALLVGITLLWQAGDRSVRYAVGLSDHLGIASFTVGFIIISLSTALPEIVIAIFSVLRDAAGLSAGDILGSSLVNLTLVLGGAAIVAGSLSIRKEYEESLLKALAIITLLASVPIIFSRLFRIHGLILIAAYAGSLWFLQRSGLAEKIMKEEEKEAEEELEKADILTGPKGTALKLAGSLAVLIIGARLTVDGALNLAALYNVPIESVGATLVAVGTGLPELSVELHAVKQKEYALALGDIFGSTLVNLTLLLGLLSFFSPSPVNTFPLLGTMVYLIFTLIVVWHAMLHNHGIDKRYGTVLLILFVLYLLEEAGVALLVGTFT